MMGFGLLFMVLFLVGIVALAIWLIKTLFPRTTQPAAPDNQGLSARQILDVRYAQGEIIREQYERMKQDIK